MTVCQRIAKKCSITETKCYGDHSIYLYREELGLVTRCGQNCVLALQTVGLINNLKRCMGLVLYSRYITSRCCVLNLILQAIWEVNEAKLGHTILDALKGVMTADKCGMSRSNLVKRSFKSRMMGGLECRRLHTAGTKRENAAGQIESIIHYRGFSEQKYDQCSFISENQIFTIIITSANSWHEISKQNWKPHAHYNSNSSAQATLGFF